MYALEGGSVGFQIGGEATDLILLVMNDRGMESILSSKVKLGADASVAAGPKGRLRKTIGSIEPPVLLVAHLKDQFQCELDFPVGS